jgi:uncharacterized protein
MSKPTSRSNPSRKSTPAHRESVQPVTVSARWLVSAISIAIGAAIVCTWLAICLMFWQGSWQLLYHPAAPVTRTPANIGLAFDNVEFAPDEDGTPQLKGWWIPGPPDARYTAIFLHDAKGNLGDTLNDLRHLRSVGLNVLAFDYRGYGQSKFVHPSERHWREDAEAAIEYLTETRHIPSASLIVAGSGLGANLALEVAARHPELAGVVLDEPVTSPADAIFGDPRATLVPAHALVRDRWDGAAPARDLRIPSLWFHTQFSPGAKQPSWRPAMFEHVISPKRLAVLTDGDEKEKEYTDALSSWLRDLAEKQ